MSEPLVLDPASGSRMMYFDKTDDRVLFGDIRTESHVLCDGRALNIEPDMEMDFRSLPFDDGTFRVVVFDPPHLGPGCRGLLHMGATRPGRSAAGRHPLTVDSRCGPRAGSGSLRAPRHIAL